MRCRKVRSYLSAYCKDELNSRHKLAVAEHLATCASCRVIEADYRHLADAGSQVAQKAVTADFNAKLFERIAQERFAETRSKAYLPKRAPMFRWRVVVPATVAMMTVFLFVFAGFQSSIMNNHDGMVMANKQLDDSYLKVQPVNNPNMTDKIHKEWSLASQLARAEQISRRTQRIINWLGGEKAIYPQMTNVSARTTYPVPYTPTYYKLRRNVLIYQTPEPRKGASTTY